MFKFRQEKSEALYGVLIDIASGSVGVAIVSSNPNEQFPKLLYAHRSVMRITKLGARKDENLRRVREALFSAALLLSQEGMTKLIEHNPKGKISRIYVTCSSPWSYTVARNVHYENDEPFKITHAIINDLIQSAENEILTHLRQESPLHEDGFEVVERATVDITINDYPVVNPFQLRGTSLGLSHIAGVIPKEILESVHEVQNKLFPSAKIRDHTYMLIMYCVMRDVFPNLHSLCIIDITGEATEFGIVEHNLLIENTFIPYGSNSFVRSVMDGAGKPASDVQTRMTTSDDSPGIIDPDLNPYVAEYATKIEKGLEHILERRVIPSDIIITAHKPHEQFFKQIVEAAFKKIKPEGVRIMSIPQDFVDEISNETGNDVYLALGARFFHKLHGCGEMNDV